MGQGSAYERTNGIPLTYTFNEYISPYICTFV